MQRCVILKPYFKWALKTAVYRLGALYAAGTGTRRPKHT